MPDGREAIQAFIEASMTDMRYQLNESFNDRYAEQQEAQDRHITLLTLQLTGSYDPDTFVSSAPTWDPAPLRVDTPVHPAAHPHAPPGLPF